MAKAYIKLRMMFRLTYKENMRFLKKQATYEKQPYINDTVMEKILKAIKILAVLKKDIVFTDGIFVVAPYC